MDDQGVTQPSLATRLKITSTLAAIGGVCGAVAGMVLTYVGNVISGYPVLPAAEIYAWNAGIIAAIGATLGPPMAWTLLRAVPLWRALAEPAAAAVVASVASMLLAPHLFVMAVPLAVTGAAVRLRWEYRATESRALESGSDGAALAGEPRVYQ